MLAKRRHKINRGNDLGTQTWRFKNAVIWQACFSRRMRNPPWIHEIAKKVKGWLNCGISAEFVQTWLNEASKFSGMVQVEAEAMGERHLPVVYDFLRATRTNEIVHEHVWRQNLEGMD